MKPTPNFVKLSRSGDMFKDSLHVVDVGSSCQDFPAAGTAYIRPHGQEEPPPREFNGHLFVHVEQVVYVERGASVLSSCGDTDGDGDCHLCRNPQIICPGSPSARFGPRPGWALVKPDDAEFSDATAVIIESAIEGIGVNDVVLIGGGGVGIEGPDGFRVVHEDQIYGVRKA